MVTGGAETLPALVATGVHRISFGSGLHAQSMRDLRSALDGVRSALQR
jgi:hypothetical protein